MALTQLGHLTPGAAQALDRATEALQAAERCSDACIDDLDPETAEPIERCRDVADLAAANASLVSRGAGMHPKLAQLTIEAALACAEACEAIDEQACQACSHAMAAFAEAGEAIASGGAVTEASDTDWADHGGRSPYSGYFESDEGFEADHASR